MKNQNELKQILKILQGFDKRISTLEGKPISTPKEKSKSWYKQGSTIEKVIALVDDKFFDTTKSISEITGELKTKDIHLSAPDLTLPLRKIVRKGILRKTKRNIVNSCVNIKQQS
jgi:hypothetical protein